MRKVFVALMLVAVWFLAFPLSHVQLDAVPVSAATVLPACGTAAWTASPGAAINAANLNAELNHLESCAASAAPNAVHNACSATSGWPCETSTTCAIASSTTCAAAGTATVPADSVCTATANASDTTTGVESFKTSLSTTTLTVTPTVASSQTTTSADSVHCL